MSLLLRIARSRGLLPRMSETEREALETGTVWTLDEYLGLAETPAPVAATA